MLVAEERAEDFFMGGAYLFHPVFHHLKAPLLVSHLQSRMPADKAAPTGILSLVRLVGNLVDVDQMPREQSTPGKVSSAVGEEAWEASQAPILLQVGVGVIILVHDHSLAHGAPATVAASTVRIQPHK